MTDIHVYRWDFALEDLPYGGPGPEAHAKSVADAFLENAPRPLTSTFRYTDQFSDDNAASSWLYVAPSPQQTAITAAIADHTAGRQPVHWTEAPEPALSSRHCVLPTYWQRMQIPPHKSHISDTLTPLTNTQFNFMNHEAWRQIKDVVMPKNFRFNLDRLGDADRKDDFLDYLASLIPGIPYNAHWRAAAADPETGVITVTWYA